MSRERGGLHFFLVPHGTLSILSISTLWLHPAWLQALMVAREQGYTSPYEVASHVAMDSNPSSFMIQ